MALLAVQTEGAEVGLRNGRVEVRRGPAVVHDRPLHEVSEVHLYGPVTVTGSAAQALLKQGCDLVWLTRHGRLVGRSFSRAGGTGTRRVAQVHTLAGQEGGRWGQAVGDAKL
ncbi:MAG: CRISPR-associated endonuclease Cas1, partial [Myxococcales bacterium]|nr:CRISPR-associated endonuclease Cas1 [Myxococcales bacterium]